VLIGFGNVTSRALGLGREAVIAALFGVTGPTSAFRTATRVSTAVYDLLLSGATTSALVPVFSDYVVGGKSGELSRVVSTLINLTVLCLGLVVAVLVVGAPVLASALGATPDFHELTVDLIRLALPSIILLGISGIMTAVLYARRSFALPAFAGAAYNVGIIGAALLLTPWLGIHGLTLGLACGATLQMILQIPALRGLRYIPTMDITHPGVRLILRLYGPVFLGMVASYAVVVIDTYLAWRTGPDSVAAMAFATTLIQFPIGLVGAAASLAFLPSLSRLASEGPSAQRAFARTLVQGLRVVLILIAPVAIVLVVVREPVVMLLFQRAAFDEAATQRTSLALLAYSPQLPFVVVDQLLIVAYYARKQTLTPVLVGVAGIGVYLVIALATVESMGMPGLALANAVQNSVHAIVLYGLLARDIPEMRRLGHLAFLASLVVGGIAAALTTTLVGGILHTPLGSSASWEQALALAATAVAGLAAYIAVMVVFRVPERRFLHQLLHLRRRLETDPTTFVEPRDGADPPA
jgi:putative peptidoglycan lipid II flippase